LLLELPLRFPYTNSMKNNKIKLIEWQVNDDGSIDNCYRITFKSKRWDYGHNFNKGNDFNINTCYNSSNGELIGGIVSESYISEINEFWKKELTEHNFERAV